MATEKKKQGAGLGVGSVVMLLFTFLFHFYFMHRRERRKNILKKKVQEGKKREEIKFLLFLPHPKVAIFFLQLSISHPPNLPARRTNTSPSRFGVTSRQRACGVCWGRSPLGLPLLTASEQFEVCRVLLPTRP